MLFFIRKHQRTLLLGTHKSSLYCLHDYCGVGGKEERTEGNSYYLTVGRSRVKGDEMCTIVKILLNAFAFQSQEMKIYVINHSILVSESSFQSPGKRQGNTKVLEV